MEQDTAAPLTTAGRLVELAKQHFKRGDVPTAFSFANDLGVDSLTVVEFIMAAEEEFGVEVPDGALEAIDSVDAMAAFVDDHLEVEPVATLVMGNTAVV